MARQHFEAGCFASASVILTMELLRLKTAIKKQEQNPLPSQATILPSASFSS
jgi:hypothetical protein